MALKRSVGFAFASRLNISILRLQLSSVVILLGDWLQQQFFDRKTSQSF